MRCKRCKDFIRGMRSGPRAAATGGLPEGRYSILLQFLCPIVSLSRDGGYHFDSPEHKEQLKAQRQQLWNWLKSVGSHMFKEGINLTKISLVSPSACGSLEHPGPWSSVFLLARCAAPACCNRTHMAYVLPAARGCDKERILTSRLPVCPLRRPRHMRCSGRSRNTAGLPVRAAQLPGAPHEQL